LHFRWAFKLTKSRHNRRVRTKNHGGKAIAVTGKFHTAGQCVSLGEELPKIREREFECAVRKEVQIFDTTGIRWKMSAKRIEKATERNKER
jgi:hypothetical protein